MSIDDTHFRLRQWQEVKLPDSTIKPSDIEIRTFTASGKEKYSHGIAIDKMLEGIDYKKLIVHYVPYVIPIDDDYGHTAKYKKQKPMRIKHG